MKTQDFIAEETMRAMESLIAQIKRLPADKVDWKPMDEGRSALDQLQECAVIGGYYPELLGTLNMPDLDEAAMAEYEKSRKALDTVEKAEGALRANTKACVEAIKKVSDENLEKSMKFFGPEPWKVSSVMNAHAWNMHWHTGQICYIQTLLGDKDM